MKQCPDSLTKVKIRETGTRRPIKNIIVVPALLSCFLFISVPLLAATREDLAHPRYYTIIEEKTVRGERIHLDDAEIYTTVDSKSIIRIIFDKEKLLETVRALAKEGKKVSIRIEAYVKPQNAEKYPITVEEYSTVVKKTEIAQEASLPESEQTKVTRFTRIESDIYYHDKKLELTDPRTGLITGTIVDTYLDLASLNLKEGERVYLTISDIENDYHFSKVLEMKSFGLKVYFTSPIILTFRQSAAEETSLAPSPGTTIVFKMVRRKEAWFEEWLHPGVNIAFLDFDEEETIELGLGVALTVYKDFFEIGYGRNLAIRENPWYWYIGLNFVHLPSKRS